MDFNVLVNLFGKCIVHDEKDKIVYPKNQEEIDDFNRIINTYTAVNLENDNIMFVKDNDYYEYNIKRLAHDCHIYTITTLTNVSTLAKGLIDHYEREIIKYRKDVTTGLDSKGLVYEKFDNYLEGIISRNCMFTCLFVDADNFKNINDTYGHEAGDVILKQISNILASSVRKEDIVGRIGGEEFVIILKNMDYENSLIKAEEIRKKAEQSFVKFNNIIIKCPTLSIGINVVDGTKLDKNSTIEDIRTSIIDSADKACYESKKNGRNMISIYNDETKSL